MKLIHLSDLHFGTENSDTVDLLLDTLAVINADHIIISGDFTQIASSKEFKKARVFMDRLPAPSFCVPGNHDIPHFRLLERLFRPFKRYKKYINDDLCPVYEQDDMIIAGLNSARPVLPHWNWANGAISGAQLDMLEQVFAKSKATKRICVFHHPIQKALNAPMNTVVFGARNALARLNEMQVGLVLTGHVHHASITTLGDIDHRTIYLSASTGLSSRLREHSNGFNVIDIAEGNIKIDFMTLNGDRFEVSESYQSDFRQAHPLKTKNER